MKVSTSLLQKIRRSQEDPALFLNTYAERFSGIQLVERRALQAPLKSSTCTMGELVAIKTVKAAVRAAKAGA